MIKSLTKKKKSLAKKYKYRPEDAELFKDVVFVVEATHHEQFTFWQDFYDNPKYDNCFIEDWVQESMGSTVCIGELDKRPINICIFWQYLEGYKVMFYEAVSQVVDHKMVDEWIQHFSKDIKYDNGHRWAHSDSNNFHHCISAIRDLVKKHGKGPGNPRGRGPRFSTTRERKAASSAALAEALRDGIKLDKQIKDLIALAASNTNPKESESAAMLVCKKLQAMLQ